MIRILLLTLLVALSSGFRVPVPHTVYGIPLEYQTPKTLAENTPDQLTPDVPSQYQESEINQNEPHEVYTLPKTRLLIENNPKLVEIQYNYVAPQLSTTLPPASDASDIASHKPHSVPVNSPDASHVSVTKLLQETPKPIDVQYGYAIPQASSTVKPAGVHIISQEYSQLSPTAPIISHEPVIPQEAVQPVEVRYDYSLQQIASTVAPEVPKPQEVYGVPLASNEVEGSPASTPLIPSQSEQHNAPQETLKPVEVQYGYSVHKVVPTVAPVAPVVHQVYGLPDQSHQGHHELPQEALKPVEVQYEYSLHHEAPTTVAPSVPVVHEIYGVPSEAHQEENTPKPHEIPQEAVKPVEVQYEYSLHNVASTAAPVVSAIHEVYGLPSEYQGHNAPKQYGVPQEILKPVEIQYEYSLHHEAPTVASVVPIIHEVYGLPSEAHQEHNAPKQHEVSQEAIKPVEVKYEYTLHKIPTATPVAPTVHEVYGLSSEYQEHNAPKQHGEPQETLEPVEVQYEYSLHHETPTVAPVVPVVHEVYGLPSKAYQEHIAPRPHEVPQEAIKPVEVKYEYTLHKVPLTAAPVAPAVHEVYGLPSEHQEQNAPRQHGVSQETLKPVEVQYDYSLHHEAPTVAPVVPVVHEVHGLPSQYHEHNTPKQNEEPQEILKPVEVQYEYSLNHRVPTIDAPVVPIVHEVYGLPSEARQEHTAPKQHEVPQEAIKPVEVKYEYSLHKVPLTAAPVAPAVHEVYGLASEHQEHNALNQHEVPQEALKPAEVQYEYFLHQVSSTAAPLVHEVYGLAAESNKALQEPTKTVDIHYDYSVPHVPSSLAPALPALPVISHDSNTKPIEIQYKFILPDDHPEETEYPLHLLEIPHGTSLMSGPSNHGHSSNPIEIKSQHTLPQSKLLAPGYELPKAIREHHHSYNIGPMDNTKPKKEYMVPDEVPNRVIVPHTVYGVPLKYRT
ncbi:uncharacterized protein LOC143202520 [Rhynchophorus ferrugineus]|uniref:uncharacterized protein LOC143202520 n=1 Tax=Rhynchophorus ferrugineus TaxID=354439 RepID=UPI003FCC9704